MTRTVLLVDYQNTKDSGLRDLPQHQRLLLFIGKNGKPKIEFIQSEIEQGIRLDLIPTLEHGNNNLDFHLAFYFGQLLAEEKGAKFFIISNDEDFDPLVRHIQGLDIDCERRGTARSAGKPAVKAAAATPAAPKSATPKAALPKQAAPSRAKAAALAPQDGNLADAVKLLKNAGSRRPKKREGLVNVLAPHFHISEAKAGKLIDALVTQGALAVSGQGVVSYKL